MNGTTTVTVEDKYSALSQLDDYLSSERTGELTKLFAPILAQYAQHGFVLTSTLMKLCDAFSRGVKCEEIVDVLTNHADSIDLVTNREDIISRVSMVLESNEPNSRAQAYQLLAAWNAYLNDYILHKMFKALESTQMVEVDAALDAILLCLSAGSTNITKYLSYIISIKDKLSCYPIHQQIKLIKAVGYIPTKEAFEWMKNGIAGLVDESSRKALLSEIPENEVWGQEMQRIIREDARTSIKIIALQWLIKQGKKLPSSDSMETSESLTVDWILQQISQTGPSPLAVYYLRWLRTCAPVGTTLTVPEALFAVPTFYEACRVDSDTVKVQATIYSYLVRLITASSTQPQFARLAKLVIRSALHYPLPMSTLLLRFASAHPKCESTTLIQFYSNRPTLVSDLTGLSLNSNWLILFIRRRQTLDESTLLSWLKTKSPLDTFVLGREALIFNHPQKRLVWDHIKGNHPFLALCQLLADLRYSLQVKDIRHDLRIWGKALDLIGGIRPLRFQYQFCDSMRQKLQTLQSQGLNGEILDEQSSIQRLPKRFFEFGCQTASPINLFEAKAVAVGASVLVEFPIHAQVVFAQNMATNEIVHRHTVKEGTTNTSFHFTSPGRYGVGYAYAKGDEEVHFFLACILVYA